MMASAQLLAFVGLFTLGLLAPASCQSVLQYHNSGLRSGVYVDPLFNATNVGTLALDPAFNVSIPGPVFAQTLYLANSSLGGVDLIIVATEQNQVLAIDARTGTTVWYRWVGPPVNGAILPCGNINPAGITGTPVIDTRIGVMAFASVTTPNGTLQGVRALAWALNITDGTVLPGFPVDIQTALAAQNQTFPASNQQQRGALTLLNDTVYIPYGGLNGDCAEYYGVVVGIPLLAPDMLRAYVTATYKGGLWSTPGVSTDGFNIFGATGNTGGFDNFNAPEIWSGGEALLRLQPGPIFTNLTRDYFSPANWRQLDDDDTDIGSSGALLVDLPGAVPAALAVAMGKNGVVYLADRNNLGGIGGELFQAKVSSSVIITTPVAYTGGNATYLALVGKGSSIGCPPGQSGDIVGLQLNAGSPPNFTVAWCAPSGNPGRTGLIVTTPAANTTAVVWSLGAGALRGFDGSSGALVYNGTQAFPSLSSWQTPIVAKGRLYFADDTRLYSFKTAGAPELPLANLTVPTVNSTLTRGPVVLPNGTVTNGSFSNRTGALRYVLAFVWATLLCMGGMV